MPYDDTSQRLMDAVFFDKLVADGQCLFWSWELSQDQFFLLGVNSDLFGFVSRFNGAPFAELIPTVVVEDRTRVLQQLVRSRQRQVAGSTVFRIQTPAGIRSVVTTFTRPLLQADGSRRIFGMTHQHGIFRSLSAEREQQSAALLRLATDPQLDQGEASDYLRKLLLSLENELNLEQVSIWLFEDAGDQLRCVDDLRGIHTGRQLKPADTPRFFDSLKERRLVSSDQLSFPATLHYTTDGEPLNAIAVSIRRERRCLGLICCQQRRPVRRWSLDDESFIKSLAELAGRVLQMAQRQQQEHDLFNREKLVDDFVNALSSQIGERFFRVMVKRLARVLEASEVYVAELESQDGQTVVQTIACVSQGRLSPNRRFSLTGIQDGNPEVAQLTTILRSRAKIQRIVVNQEQMIGTQLVDPRGNPLGVIMVRAPLADFKLSMAESLLKVCAIRATAELERQLKDAELRLAAVAFETNEGLIITDPQRRILRVNRAFSQITGYQAEEVSGKVIDLLDGQSRGGLSYHAILDNTDRDGRWQGEQVRRRKNGQAYPQWETVTSVENRYGQVSHYVICFEDLSERKQAERQIQHLAYYDELTGLPNRRMLLERLQEAFTSARAHGRVGALLFIDLDHFKTINDSLGHATGDWLLQRVAERLKCLVRQHDVLARLGGDEFVILLPQLGDKPPHAEQQAQQIADRLIRDVSAPYPFDGQPLHIGASVGVTLFPGSVDGYQDLLKQADTAMYQAKNAGRQRLCFFDDTMQRKADKRLRIHNQLRTALDRNELRLHYQPQHFVATGELVGMEALIRWQKQDTGMLIAPAEFIPVAEESDLIIDIGRWVLRQACRQFMQWREEAVWLPQISVNVSAKQFHHAGFVDEIVGILQETGMEPCCLNLEITESVVLGHAEETIRKMERLKQLGLSFSIDDFGAGYSSLTYLKRLPADELKIDRSFIRDIPRDRSDMAIVEAVLALARHMGFNVTAEGVETPQQLEFLNRYGCSFYQGFLASKPLSADALSRYSRRYKVAGVG